MEVHRFSSDTLDTFSERNAVLAAFFTSLDVAKRKVFVSHGPAVLELMAVKILQIATCSSGEELTIDYAWPANAAIVCRCGAGTCRGWIVSPEELSDVLDRDVANSPSE